MASFWRRGVCALWLSLAGIAACQAEERAVIEFDRKADAMLQAGRFQALEAMAAELRRSDARFVGGNAKLAYFYRALGSFAGKPFADYESAQSFDDKRRQFKSWLKKMPNSSTARIGMAELWRARAWRERGTAYADEVRPEQWQHFNEALDNAAFYLIGVDPDTDPEVYELQIDLAKGRGAPRDSLDALYAAAVRRFPTYYYFYLQRARILEPKWFGQEGELADYVRSVLQSPGGEDGQVAYSYVAFALLRDYRPAELFTTTGLSWPAVEAAYAVREKRYGLRSMDWNALCRLAVTAGDLNAAKNALRHVGDDWDKEVWSNKQYFDSVVAWIHEH